MSFVRFSDEEFLEAMTSTRRKFRRISMPKTWEEVYSFEVSELKNVSILVYSSVDKTTGWSRDKGADAIRVVAFDTVKKRAIDSETKTLRTQGWRERIVEKVEELYGKCVEHQCPACGGLLVERGSQYGRFLGCSNYPSCRFIHGNKIQHIHGSSVDVETGEVMSEVKSGPFESPDKKEEQRGLRQWLKETVKVIADNIKGTACPRCGGELLERRGKRGDFLGCSNYPECEFTENI